MPAPKAQSNLVNYWDSPVTDAGYKFVFTSPLVVGDTILFPFNIWHVSADDTTKPVASLADQLGNTYTIVSQEQSGNNSHQFTVWVYSRVTVAGTPTITPTFNFTTALNRVKGRAYAWDCFYASPIDKIKVAKGGAAATGATTGTQALTYSAPFMTLSAYANGMQSTAAGAPSGFTMLDNSPTTGGSDIDFAFGYKDETTASSAGPSVAWTNPAATYGTVAVTLFAKLACRARGRVSAAGQNATSGEIEVWPTGDSTTCMATRLTGRTIDANGYALLPVDPAWSKAVGSTLSFKFKGTDAVTGTVRGHRDHLIGTVEIGQA